MKKYAFNKVILTLVALVTMCFASSPALALNTGSNLARAEIVAPRYVAIRTIHVTLSFSGSQAQCKTYATLFGSYTAETSMSLQNLDGTWKTVMDWSTDGSMCSEKYYVTHGTYRVAGTVNIYDARGNLVESVSDYSDIVTY